MTRRFELHRSADSTGVSGTGVVADGVQWPDGSVVLRWRSRHASTVVLSSIEDAERVHGHSGSTRTVWSDPTAVLATVRGLCGRAQQVAVPADERTGRTVAWWLIDAPAFSHLWSQYLLVVVRLDGEVPGVEAPAAQFDGATHQLMILTLDPGQLIAADELHDVTPDTRFHALQPLNVVQQFEATDEEMVHLADLSATDIVNGTEPEDNDRWLAILVKTLAHIRGEPHAP